MIKHGLISDVDAETIEKTLRLILSEFNGYIFTTEVGVFNGETSRGINQFIKELGRVNFHTAIDSKKDFDVESPFDDCNFIIGNSNEVYNQIPKESQHFIFIDGCHAFPMVVSDFFCYSDKVKSGGYLAFHDTGDHILPFKDYQSMGSKHDKDMYISCRKALRKIGLLDNKLPEWELVYDEADTSNEAGGICVFKKI